MSGKELKLTGYDKTSPKSFDDDKTYLVKSVEYNMVNHERRMLSAFTSNGPQGLFHYSKVFFSPDKHAELWQGIAELFTDYKLNPNEVPTT
jgi:hypothetical protein